MDRSMDMDWNCLSENGHANQQVRMEAKTNCSTNLEGNDHTHGMNYDYSLPGNDYIDGAWPCDRYVDMDWNCNDGLDAVSTETGSSQNEPASMDAYDQDCIGVYGLSEHVGTHLCFDPYSLGIDSRANDERDMDLSVKLDSLSQNFRLPPETASEIKNG